METSTKPGRKPTGRQRNHQVLIRVSEEEHIILKELVKEAHTDISKFMRRYVESCIEQFGRKSKETSVVTINNKIQVISKQEAKDLYTQLTKILIG